MANKPLCNVLKVSNHDPDSKFDCETLKKILFEKGIHSEIAKIEDEWLIKVDCLSLNVITEYYYRLSGKFEDQSYYFVFKITDDPFPDQHSSLNISCTGDAKARIFVSNYPSSTTAGSLQSFFENHINGGRIEYIDFKQNHTCIIFFDPEVAEKVCSKGAIPFRGKLLHVDKDNYEKPAEKYEEGTKKCEEGAKKCEEGTKKYPEPAEKYEADTKKYPEPAEKYPKSTKRNLSQIATKTICVSNVPEEMDLENVECFFKNKRNGGGKMEKNPTRNPQTNDVEITFADEKIAKSLVEKSPVTYNNCTLAITLKKPFLAEKVAEEVAEKKADAYPVIYDRQTILVHGVPENISLDEVKLYFQNRRSSKGGKIKSCENYRKGIKITFVSAEIVNNVLTKNNHVIGGNSLEVQMYIPPKMEEKQLLLSDIKPNVLHESLKNFLEVEIDLNVDDLKMIQSGVWLVYCENKIDFEKVKSDLKDKNKKFISETYSKAKQIELTDKIILRNIPEEFTMDYIETYFKSALNPDHRGTPKMLPGRRCIVTFKTYDIASMWSKAKHEKFDCNLYYDYADEDEMCTEIKISSDFMMQFIMNHKNVFEEELKDYGYFAWSESQGNSLKIQFGKSIKEKEIQRKVTELLKTIFEEELSIPPNVFPELNETYRHESDAVQVYFDNQNHRVHILSFNKTLVEENKKNFLCIVETKSKTSEVVELYPHQISLLYADLFPSKIYQKYKLLKINREPKKITLTGSVSDISDVTREIHKYLSAVLCIQCHLPRNSYKIVSQKKVKEYLQKNLKKDDLICSWELNAENEVMIYSINNKNLISAKNIFNKVFLSFDFDITDPMKKLMKGEKWKTFLNNISTKYSDVFHINDQQDDKITIITTEEFSKDLGDDFGKFFDTNVIYTTTLPLKSGFFEYLKAFCQNDVQQFSDDNMPVNIQFHNDQMVHISATNQVNKKALEFLKKLTRDIIEKREEISHLGFKRFLNSDAADTMFRKLSKDYKCIILKEEDNTKNIWKKPSADVEMKSANTSIRIHEGDITEIEADALVNPANRKLEHIGGLGKHLCDKGGPAIQKESSDIIARKTSKQLQEGSVEVTTAGKLKSKIIIHAVGPGWNNGKSYEAESLEEAVTNSLSAAEKNNCTSIAFPAISTGIFRFPVDQATGVIVRSIKDYLDNFPQTRLKYIYLVSIKEDVISAFKQQLKSIFPKEFGQSSNYNNGANDQGAKSKSPPLVAPKPAKNVNNSTKIEIELGLLNKIKCDAIVNTTNSALDLNSGAISKAILADAGDGLQMECYKHSFASQQIVVTDGFNLPCSKVFHICLPHWQKSSADVVKSTVRNCLDKAEALNLQHIAFPAFGTGNLRYPPDIVAMAMFSAASEYISDTKTGLQKISFVIFPKDTPIKMAFENASSGEITLPSSVRNYDMAPMRDEPISDVLPQDKNFSVDINGINLIILQGNIVEEKADGIVHGTNLHFSLNGVISRALLSRMGPQLTQDCKSKRSEMESQNYVITKASLIAASYIVHVNMEGIKKHPEKIFRLCFDAAEGEKMKSLALPPLGTGGLGCTVDDITKNFLNALKSFGKSSPKYLKTVKFVIFNADLLPEICQIIGKETKSFFKKIASYLTPSAKTMTQTDQSEYLQTENITPSPVSLFFYADSMKTLDKTKDSIISQYKKDYLFCKEIEDKNISELPRQQLQEIMKLQREHEVKIEIKSSKITISGYKDDAMSVHGDIQSIILSFVNDMKIEQAAELMEKIVQWNYITYDQGKSKVEPYPKDINQQLEEAYQNDKMLTLTRGGKSIIFDMRKPEEMVEYEDANPKKTIKIVRNDKTQSGDALPESWSPMGNSNYMKVELKSGDEYDKVKNAFPINFTIVKIERIQNIGLYRKYKAHLEQTELTNPQGTTNEIQGLWHGTSEDVTEKINSRGFDRGYCGKNAVAYGAGVYFARDAQYSLGSTYSPPNRNGHKHIYMCNVITGISCLGSPNIRFLQDNPQVPGTKFDSSVNDLTAPTIYVIFHDASAYPAYLITCH